MGGGVSFPGSPGTRIVHTCSPPAQLQCLRSGAEEPGNEARLVGGGGPCCLVSFPDPQYTSGLRMRLQKVVKPSMSHSL